jgi:very-short-patch-repair endonuclease
MHAKLSQSRQQLVAGRAREMRFAQTPSEESLWRVIRGKRLGVAFRRQYPIGKYIADFAAPSVKLAIEVDGGYHVSRASADARKDRYLRRAGYRVLRLDAELVRTNPPEALARIRVALANP